MDEIAEPFAPTYANGLIPQAHGGALQPPKRKGDPAHPGAGRPPSVTAALYRILRMRPAKLARLRASEKRRVQDDMALALVDRALSGDIDALKLAWDRSPDGPLLSKTVHEHIETRKLVIAPKRQAQPQLEAPQERIIDLPASPNAVPATDVVAPITDEHGAK